jgi:NADH-quinone oxidoreductase subunit G
MTWNENSMADLVTLIIDDTEYQVPAGMNLVDAAKHCGVDIPVFCYHPKLGHDGNCRMCLVELGTPRRNRETGEVALAWFPGVQTACTQTVVDGMAIRTTSETVIDARREILEFILSSHPLDCPICDKGGECPLQNLTMRHGPGTTRMYWNDRMRLGKHVPLGEMIYLDQERCILCARCIRFQDKVADDPVLGFDLRGRKQQIITRSEPGFDSIFSGNTTDICPVGALTTADFRFNARPWEMVQVATLCSHTPEGSNMYFDTRVDREAGGRTTIKRVMPRQNEQVNEIWISDKSRFVHHYMEHPDRLTSPMLRKGGQLVEVTWDEALSEVVAQLEAAGAEIGGIAGGRLSNESLFAFQRLIRAQGSNNLAAYPARVAGAELVAQIGVGCGTNLQDLGEGDAILVAACDLHQEAPVWWLRVKAAAERGAVLIVLNGRATRLDDYAAHSLRYEFGGEVASLNAMLGSLSKRVKAGREVEGLDEVRAAAAKFPANRAMSAATRAFAGADNAVVMVGSDGVGASVSQELAQAAANLLVATGHVGRANNGLIVVWGAANSQGAFDMGVHHAFGPGYQPLAQPGLGYEGMLRALQDNALKALIIAGADPVFDDRRAEDILRATHATIIVQDMFLTQTAELADVVLPTQSIAEQDGTYTSGERRIQRFYQAIEPIGESRSVWEIAQTIGEQLGQLPGKPVATLIFNEIALSAPPYEGITGSALTHVEQQFPDVGGEDMYFGGTAFTNRQGLGVQWPTLAEDGRATLTVRPAQVGAQLSPGRGQLIAVPVTSLYDAEPVMQKTDLLQERVPAPHAALNPAEADRLGVAAGDPLEMTFNGHPVILSAVLDEAVPEGVAVVPRRLQAQGAPLAAAVTPVTRLERVSS